MIGVPGCESRSSKRETAHPCKRSRSLKVAIHRRSPGIHQISFWPNLRQPMPAARPSRNAGLSPTSDGDRRAKFVRTCSQTKRFPPGDCSGDTVRNPQKTAVGLRPPKAEVTSSNLVGCTKNRRKLRFFASSSLLKRLILVEQRQNLGQNWEIREEIALNHREAPIFSCPTEAPPAKHTRY